MFFFYFDSKDFQNVTDAARKGIDLLNKQIDSETLNIWHRYVKSVLQKVSMSGRTNYYNQYLDLYNSLLRRNARDQIEISVNFLLDVAEQIKGR